MAKRKNTLLGFEYKLIGFMFDQNKSSKNKNRKRVQFTFFQQFGILNDTGVFLICLKSLTLQEEGISRIQLNKELGSLFEPEDLFITVQRSIEGLTREQFSKIMEDCCPDKATIAWT